ncbi:hypothetical protein LINPERPRIM_LOCUS17882 [Linum perenne]
MSQSSPFPSCFRPSSAAASDANHHRPPSPPPPPPPPLSGKPNLATSFYQTELGVFSLTWSRTFLGHSLNLHLQNHDGFSSSSLSFNLHIKPFVFWRKHGSKRLLPDGADLAAPKFQIYWDLSRAKFGSGPEPQSGFYIAVVADREIVLLVGDLAQEAWGKTKARRRPGRRRNAQSLILRKEHVFGNRVYSTRARFGGRSRHISIDCSEGRLNFAVDNKKVLQIKRLKWKFRGNERIEVDGVPIQISWDVYNWLFDVDGNSTTTSNTSNNSAAKHALFMFRFEAEEEDDAEEYGGGDATPAAEAWKPEEQHQSNSPWRKVKRSLMMKNSGARSSSWSSVSMSSASSSIGTNTSVMEWAHVEESELGCGPDGFSLLVYAWKK